MELYVQTCADVAPPATERAMPVLRGSGGHVMESVEVKPEVRAIENPFCGLCAGVGGVVHATSERAIFVKPYIAREAAAYCQAMKKNPHWRLHPKLDFGKSSMRGWPLPYGFTAAQNWRPPM
ncbi:MAG: hypothetical protein H8M99_06900 [Gloeobacteraceae cyanobacterium ES-bin-144]|nr:hypothetical protein [Verrucomicrobiales bacterium]